jgi:hypothetical protein
MTLPPCDDEHRSQYMKGIFVDTKTLQRKIARVTRAWRRMRPKKTFFRLSIDKFTHAVAPSLKARADLAELEQRVREARARRDEADEVSRKLLRHVVAGVLGDPDENDGELYKAMGYQPRAAGLSCPGEEGAAAKASASNSSKHHQSLSGRR